MELGGNAVRQMNVPPPFVVIHFQNDAGASPGRCVMAELQEEVIRPHLRNRDGFSVAKQLHSEQWRNGRRNWTPKSCRMNFSWKTLALMPGRHQLQLAERLGFGIHGIVFICGKQVKSRQKRS